MSVAPSRLLFGLIPWYSFLIVIGASVAIILAYREEKRANLKKDTVIDFALWVLPIGIVGARIYYVLFSWSDFKDDPLSILRIWEGGIAIYGAVIAGLLTAWVFSRKRKISFLSLCDVVAPGLILAQALGRWGNYFNQEAYGISVNNPNLQFFPFAVQIQTDSGLQWHMATFFYEFLWNLSVFIFLMIARRKWFKYRGDVICFYAFLYSCGRLIIEDFRIDSLYATSSIRISQLLSIIICIVILIRYIYMFRTTNSIRCFPMRLFCISILIINIFMLIWMAGLIDFKLSVSLRFLSLLSSSLINIVFLFTLYGSCSKGKVLYANQ